MHGSYAAGVMTRIFQNPVMKRGETILKSLKYMNYFFSLVPCIGNHWRFINGRFRNISRYLSKRNSSRKLVDSQVQISFFDFQNLHRRKNGPLKLMVS